MFKVGRGIIRLSMAAAGSLLFGSHLSAAVPSTSLSVLTYNVEGLPWPLRLGRDADFARMAASLRRLRATGGQPHVIVLEEAFTPAAKAIARDAGYRYVADGPARDDRGGAPQTAQDRRFAANASLLHGERAGKWADSGLRIASDYPILSVRRMPFPGFACAGYDCLANKGVMVVTLAVPGAPQPVAVVATHLNSRAASGVGSVRSLYAYRRQIDTVGAFVRTAVPAGLPLVFAGDFNAGKRLDRRGYLVESAATWRPQGAVSVAMDECLADGGCAKSGEADLRYSFKRGKDWQFFSSGRMTSLRVAALSVPFGHDRMGEMLSDHVGYIARYTLGTAARAIDLRLASR